MSKEHTPTAEEILDECSSDTTTKGRVKWADAIAAMEEIASIAWDTANIGNGEHNDKSAPTKEEFMKKLFKAKTV